MVQMSPLVVVVAVALATLPSALYAGPKVQRLPIVDRAIEHHGGALFERVEVSFTLSSLSGGFDVVSRVEDGMFDYAVERTREGVVQGWRHTNGGVWRFEDGVELGLDDEGRRGARDFVSARIYFCFLPYRLNDASTFKEDLGVETWGGRALHKVKVTFTPGSSTNAADEYLYWFDPETARLEQFAYSFDGGLRFRRLVDYRRIGGILFADQENHGVNRSGLTVDLVGPDFVAGEMELVSTVELGDIEVRELASAEP
jgi:hypothetical protein